MASYLDNGNYDFPLKGVSSSFTAEFFDNLALDDVDIDVDQATTPPPEFMRDSLREDYASTPFDPYLDLNASNAPQMQNNFAPISFGGEESQQWNSTGSSQNYNHDLNPRVDDYSSSSQVVNVAGHSGGTMFLKAEKKRNHSSDPNINYCPSTDFNNMRISEDPRISNLSEYAEPSYGNSPSPYRDDGSTCSTLSPDSSEGSGGVRGRKSLTNLSQREKEERIRQQNNIASKEYRKRKKENSRGAEVTESALKAKNDKLRQQERSLRSHLMMCEEAVQRIANAGFSVEQFRQIQNSHVL